MAKLDRASLTNAVAIYTQALARSPEDAVAALVAGALFSDFVESVLHKSITTIGVAFILGGFVMLWLDRRTAVAGTRTVDDTSVGQAAVEGPVDATCPGCLRIAMQHRLLESG